MSKRVERKNGVIRLIDPPLYMVFADDAEAKAIAVELYAASDGGGDSVTVTENKEVLMRPSK